MYQLISDYLALPETQFLLNHWRAYVVGFVAIACAMWALELLQPRRPAARAPARRFRLPR